MKKDYLQAFGLFIGIALIVATEINNFKKQKGE